MSLLPLLYDDNWFMNPSRILDQQFGMGLDPSDFMTPLMQPFSTLSLRGSRYFRPWRSASALQDIGSTISTKNDKYQISLDVQHFTPEEVTVKVTGKNVITVEGKHEEKPDEHGFIYRHFIRRYMLPEGHDINNVVSNLSSDGVLSITAPRIPESGEEHRTIPIQQTGAPVKVITQGKQDTPTYK